MIDRPALLATLRPVVGLLEASIRERAVVEGAMTAHLEGEYERAVSAQRTAMSLEEWRDGEITQAAVAWVLGCVFVRFLEDNGLIDQPLISGPADRRASALGHRDEHFRVHPADSDREYLEACFREVARYPAVTPLYDEAHNPLWRLGPSADGARRLRETFSSIDPESGTIGHDFSDESLDTRFLGDLYQDLSEAAKKRYALLQTPDFVERFILDRTLTPAIEEFGLDEVRLIDPTCGSGHFLIGAFGRLFAMWQERDPGTDLAVLAQRALDQVAGVDLNPYATGIARFRLVIAALRACGVSRLAEAPAFTLHLASGDSLLHGPLPADGASMLFDANQLSKNIAHVYESEDGAALKEILGRGYHAVVGNPPYIAVQDAAMRDAYRARYASTHGHFVLTVPFMERFFELAQLSGETSSRAAGFVGKITGNTFMKREFGGPLVERFLPSVDVQTVVDASGAYLPGHGTPTVLLFGRARRPVGATLRVVDGVRGEPKQPADPANGLVWKAIEEVVDRVGEQNQFVRCSDVSRAELLTHPMTLGLGRDIRAKLEAGARTVASAASDVGFCAVTREDDAYWRSEAVGAVSQVAEFVVDYVVGESVRDWAVSDPERVLWPYDGATLQPATDSNIDRALWPVRQLLKERVAFGKSQVERGLEWFEYSMFMRGRYRSEVLVWPIVATHAHFARVEEPAVSKDSVCVIVTPSRDACIALAAVLNSSVGCFWLKQVCQPKGSSGMGRGIYDEAWEAFYAFNATNVKELPLPARHASDLAGRLDALACERVSLFDDLADGSNDVSLARSLSQRAVRDAEITAELIGLQEELDWQMLVNYGLAPAEVAAWESAPPAIELGQRAFEILLARRVAAGTADTEWFERHRSSPRTSVPETWPFAYRELVERRLALLESDPDIELIERAEHKRRWSRSLWADRQRAALTRLVLDALESPTLWADLRPRSTAELADHARTMPRIVEALELLAADRDADLAATVRQIVVDAAAPPLAAQRLNEKGLRKRSVWERVWDLQRQEDRGDASTGSIPLPPRYAQSDFRSGTYWKYRGKLDVQTERFVLLPTGGRGADQAPVVGWSGWNERDLARAIAGRVTEMREHDAASEAALIPLLATVLELLPAIAHWYPDSDPLYGGSPATYFEGWLDAQLSELAVTRDTLRSWRPLAPTRGRKAKANPA